MRGGARARRAREHAAAEPLGARLAGVSLLFHLKVGPQGKAFGSVTDRDVADALAYIAAADIVDYAEAIESVVESFETRTEDLEEARVADTALVLDLLARRRGIVRITYPDGRIVSISPGNTILEASRLGGVSHASVCGGRGRCSTCRVRVLQGAEHLPQPSLDEKRVLDRIGSPAWNMNLVVGNVLDLYRLEEDGRFHLDTRQFDPNGVIAEAADDCASQARRKVRRPTRAAGSPPVR